MMNNSHFRKLKFQERKELNVRFLPDELAELRHMAKERGVSMSFLAYVLIQAGKQQQTQQQAQQQQIQPAIGHLCN